MPEYTNPAKRLYDSLDTIMTRQRLGSDASFADTIGQLFSIINSYEQFVNRSETMTEDQKSMHLGQLQDVKSALAQSNNWGQVSSRLDKNFVRNFYWAAVEMSHHWDEYGIKEEDLASLQAEIDELTSEIVDSDLDAQLKSVLTSGLNGVRQAILEYRIHGAEGLRQALDKIIDDMIRYREEFNAASTENGTRELIRNCFEIILKVDNLVSTGLKIKQIAGTSIKGIMLMLGSGD